MFLSISLQKTITHYSVMFRIFLITILFFLASVSMHAGDPTNVGDDKKITMASSDKKGLQRPQLPTSQYVECIYSGGCLYISFRNPEGVCELTVTTVDNAAETFTFDSSAEAVINVGELTTAHLLITTEYGHSYEGHLY